jgi:hypothetical protein
MSRKGKMGPVPAGGWLEGDQQRAWLAYIRVQLRLAYEMNRQLLADSGMSLPDYDVLTGLSVADGGRMPITVLAAQIGWERSRVSHHVRRMSARGLVTCGPSAADRRIIEVTPRYGLEREGRSCGEHPGNPGTGIGEDIWFPQDSHREPGSARPARQLDGLVDGSLVMTSTAWRRGAASRAAPRGAHDLRGALDRRPGRRLSCPRCR